MLRVAGLGNRGEAEDFHCFVCLHEPFPFPGEDAGGELDRDRVFPLHLYCSESRLSPRVDGEGEVKNERSTRALSQRASKNPRFEFSETEGGRKKSNGCFPPPSRPPPTVGCGSRVRPTGAATLWEGNCEIWSHLLVAEL